MGKVSRKDLERLIEGVISERLPYELRKDPTKKQSKLKDDYESELGVDTDKPGDAGVRALANLDSTEKTRGAIGDNTTLSQKDFEKAFKKGNPTRSGAAAVKAAMKFTRSTEPTVATAAQTEFDGSTFQQQNVYYRVPGVYLDDSDLLLKAGSNLSDKDPQ